MDVHNSGLSLGDAGERVKGGERGECPAMTSTKCGDNGGERDCISLVAAVELRKSPSDESMDVEKRLLRSATAGTGTCSARACALLPPTLPEVRAFMVALCALRMACTRLWNSDVSPALARDA